MRPFLDSYALIEILNGNPDFSVFVDRPCITSLFNYAEVYYHLVSLGRKKEADAAHSMLKPLLADIPADCVRDAMEFRHEFNSQPRNRKSKLSYADAISYTFALQNGCEFVTGDDAFKGLKCVKFIK